MTSFHKDYVFLKRMNIGLVGLTSSYGQQLFARIKMRKWKPCALCEVGIKVGETAYKPMTNKYNRMHRLCVPCVTKLECAP